MAVDYLHRLLITGRHEAVRRVVSALYREYSRAIGGQTFTEVVPFSFEALYQLAPSAIRIEREAPCDPYELAAWPIRKRTKAASEARYQFQTRNLEMAPFIRLLAKSEPRLTFTFVTLCLDDSSVESHSFAFGTTRKWTLPERRREFHWEGARRKFRLTGDAVYDDEDAERWAEEQMLAEALAHWQERSGRGRGGRPYEWWNRPSLRDLESERELALFALSESLSANRQDSRDQQSNGTKKTRLRH